MLVFIIFAVMLVITVILTILTKLGTLDRAYTYTMGVKSVKSKFWKFWYDINCNECVYVIGIVLIVVFSLICIGLSIGAIGTKALQDIKYEQMQYQYIVLTERLEEDNNNYHLFYEDICEYNNAILEDRYWADNLWVNWYHNGKIKDLPLIGE